MRWKILTWDEFEEEMKYKPTGKWIHDGNKWNWKQTAKGGKNE